MGVGTGLWLGSWYVQSLIIIQLCSCSCKVLTIKVLNYGGAIAHPAPVSTPMLLLTCLISNVQLLYRYSKVFILYNMDTLGSTQSVLLIKVS